MLNSRLLRKTNFATDEGVALVIALDVGGSVRQCHVAKPLTKLSPGCPAVGESDSLFIESRSFFCTPPFDFVFVGPP